MAKTPAARNEKNACYLKVVRYISGMNKPIEKRAFKFCPARPAAAATSVAAKGRKAKAPKPERHARRAAVQILDNRRQGHRCLARPEGHAGRKSGRRFMAHGALPRSFNAAAMPRSDVTPAACSSEITGAMSPAALATGALRKPPTPPSPP